MQEKKTTSRFATISLICGILGLITAIFYGGVFGVIGLVYGVFALIYKMEGKNRAIVGIVTSICAIGITILIVNTYCYIMQNEDTRVRMNQFYHNLVTQLEEQQGQLQQQEDLQNAK